MAATSTYNAFFIERSPLVEVSGVGFQVSGSRPLHLSVACLFFS
jgi:hypothetical protein